MARLLHDEILKSKGGRLVPRRTRGGRPVEPSVWTGESANGISRRERPSSLQAPTAPVTPAARGVNTGRPGERDVIVPSYDQTGLREIPIAQDPTYDAPSAPAPHLDPAPPAYVREHSSIDPKPSMPAGRGEYRDPAQTRRVPISGNSQRLEPPLQRPLDEPSGPPFEYGYDNLGSTAAPPRYIDSSPHSRDVADGVSARDVAQAIPDMRREIETTRFPVDPDGIVALRGQRFPIAPWPHGSRFMEAGAPGTGIFSGFIAASTTGEFNPHIFGWDAMAIYEQMRRTDGDVAAGLLAMMLPLLSVTPEIVPGDGNGGYTGAGSLAKEIAEFVRENLFGNLERENPAFRNTWVSQSFQEVKENALMMLPFGCAAHENLYRIDGNRIRLRFLAPRMPWTFYRWWTAEDGETLTGLEQLGYRRERYISSTIPANQVCVFVNRKEGSNWYGIAAIRPAYVHWYLKNGFYRIDSIALERNGMGIPWIQFPPGAKKEDITKAQAWVEQMAVSERTGLALPDGYKFELAGLRGRLRDPIHSIQHHSQMIVRTIMAMFIALGTTETGSRALANTLLDFFRQSLQHYASIIGSTISNFTIRPLVDFNYRPLNGRRLPYPRLEFPSINVIDPIETAEVINKLANSQVDVIHSSQELEKAVLQKFGLPYGPGRTKFAPTTTMVRIMAQPAGLEGVPRAGPGFEVEPQRVLEVSKGGQAVEPEGQGGIAPIALPGAQAGEVGIGGKATDIHDEINKITHGDEGTGAAKKRARQTSKKGRLSASDVDFNGIPVTIENRAGSVRHGRDGNGNWRTEMKYPYGFLSGTIGLDQEEIDAFVGPYKRAKKVYIVHSRNPVGGTPDEEKVFLGFRSSAEAKNAFLSHYSDPGYFGDIRSMPLAEFKSWLDEMRGRPSRSSHAALAEHQREVGIDLDGTLAEQVTPFDKNKVGAPIPDGIKKVKRLEKAGYKVWIFTARTDLQPVVNWAVAHHLDLPVTNVKRPSFVAIVDDRAVRASRTPDETVKRVEELT